MRLNLELMGNYIFYNLIILCLINVGTIKKPPYPYSVLYKCDDYEKPMEVFRGTTEEVINYKFYNMFTLKCDFLKFQIDYSL